MLLTAAAGVAAGCSSRSTEQQASAPAVDLKFEPAEADVDLGGVKVRTWAYNGRVPGKEIRIRKGETLRVAVSNKLPTDTSIHWHGLAIVNDMDGVPPLTQSPIPAGGNFTYEFAVPDAGTYWYHSHVGTQLDRGLYGPLIIEDPAETADYDEELVLVLDDWIDGTGTNPDQVLENLRKTGMKPMEPGGPRRQPRRLRSAPTAATSPTRTSSSTAASRPIPQTRDYRAGQRIRLRVINAGSDTAFRVAMPDTDLNVIATDGYPVMPRGRSRSSSGWASASTPHSRSTSRCQWSPCRRASRAMPS